MTRRRLHAWVGKDFEDVWYDHAQILSNYVDVVVCYAHEGLDGVSAVFYPGQKLAYSIAYSHDLSEYFFGHKVVGVVQDTETGAIEIRCKK